MRSILRRTDGKKILLPCTTGDSLKAVPEFRSAW